MAERKKRPSKDKEVKPELIPMDRSLPQNVEMERGVLGSILLDPQVLDEVQQILREDDFYLDAHQALYREFLAIHNSGKFLDSKTLVEFLERDEAMERVGGMAYIAEVVHSVVTPAHAVGYADVIRDKARLRKLIQASSMIIQKAYEPDSEVNTLVSEAEELIFSVHDERSNDSVMDMMGILEEVWKKVNLYKEGHAVGIPTGFTDLDKKTGGLHDSELIIIAARPSMGKSAFAANIADYVSMEVGKYVLFVSLEMSHAELGLRLLCGRAGVDSQRVRQGRLSVVETHRLQEATTKLMEARLNIDDSPSRTVSDIAALARRYKRKGQLDMIMVDYLQFIKDDGTTTNRQEQVAKISRRLKELARELHVPVVCLAQLNRQTEEGGKDHRPKMSNLRESGSIEQDADVVMFIHREEYYHQGKPDEIEAKGLAGQAEIIIAKQRNGPTGIVKLQWEASLTQFRNLAMQVHDDLPNDN
ncbi:MAG: replicative DNA helicase [Thermoguttaceae bacterium]|nr:replicative DNA helicase [Thermoguttaceae bacterium]